MAGFLRFGAESKDAERFPIGSSGRLRADFEPAMLPRDSMEGAGTLRPEAERSRRPALELALWIAAFLVARGLLVLSFADVFGYGEELEKACAAKAMLDDLGVPHHQLAYHYYEGGGFVVSHLDALAFLALGQSIFAVKVVALFMGVCVLTAGWALARRFGGAAASRAFGLLYVLAPESVQKNSLLALGIHFHACLFIALILFFAGAAIAERGRRGSTWLALGIAAGFGLYFSFQCALTVVVAVVALVWSLRGACLSRAAGIGAIGFVVGLGPLLWMASNVGAEVLDIHGAELVGGTSKADKLGEFFGSVFAGRSALDWVALIALGATPLLGVLALRKSMPAPMRLAAWLVLAHALLFAGAYLASGFTVGRVYHYFLLHRLTPLWFLAILLAAFGAAAAMRGGPRSRALALCAVATLAGSGLVDAVQLVRHAAPRNFEEHIRRLWRTRGYAYPEYLHKVSAHVGGDTEEKVRVFSRFDEPGLMFLSERAILADAIAVAAYGDGSRGLEDVRRDLRKAGVGSERPYLLGLGPMLRAQLGGDIASRVKAVESYPPDVRDALIEAIGRFGLGNLVTEDRIAKEIEQGLAGNLPVEYFDGVGHRMYSARGDLGLTRYFEMRSGPWMLDRERAEDFLLTLPPKVGDRIRHAFDRTCLEHTLTPPFWLWD